MKSVIIMNLMLFTLGLLCTTVQSADRSTIASSQIPLNYTINRANYTGKLKNDLIEWNAIYDIELFAQDKIVVQLLSTQLILSDLQVDNTVGIVFEKDDHYAVLLQGSGHHSLSLQFQTPVTQLEGPPQVKFELPQAPINNVKLNLPGKYIVSIYPKTNVKHHYSQSGTTIITNVKIDHSLLLSWTDYIPAKLRDELQANANVYHTFFAEEGVIHAQATVSIDINRGSTQHFSIAIPEQVQIVQITAPTGGIIDWSTTPAKNGLQNIVKIYLERKISGPYKFLLEYELLFEHKNQAMVLPLARVLHMHSHKGMVSLLADSELSLIPVHTINMYTVGETALPEDIRNRLYKTVQNTYKYSATYPKLSVEAVVPAHLPSIFSANINTLVSINDMYLKCESSIQIDTISGNTYNLTMKIADDVIVTNISGPAIKQYQINNSSNSQLIDIEFNQAMKGQYRIAVNYEKPFKDKSAETDVPLPTITQAQTNYGNIAVVTPSTFDIFPTKSNNLTLVDMEDIPQQLAAKTNQPVLLAYKYTATAAPNQLAIRVIEHKVLAMQDAIIENAIYKSLLTSDGLIVTLARFNLKNSQRQFLHLELPPEFKLWSVSVDGNADNTTVIASHDNNANTVLVKLFKSTVGYWIDITYSTSIEKLDAYGSFEMVLPVPDLIVSHTSWDIILPAGHQYYGVNSNMDFIDMQSFSSFANESSITNDSQTSFIKSAHAGSKGINMPAQGYHFGFNKLYSDITDDPSRVTFQYAASMGFEFAKRFSVVAVILVWIGLFALRFSKPALSSSVAYTLVISGFIVLAAILGYLGTASFMSVLFAVIGGVVYLLLVVYQKTKSVAGLT